MESAVLMIDELKKDIKAIEEKLQHLRGYL